jgi:hypothetical protein
MAKGIIPKGARYPINEWVGLIGSGGYQMEGLKQKLLSRMVEDADLLNCERDS